MSATEGPPSAGPQRIYRDGIDLHALSLIVHGSRRKREVTHWGIAPSQAGYPQRSHEIWKLEGVR